MYSSLSMSVAGMNSCWTGTLRGAGGRVRSVRVPAGAFGEAEVIRWGRASRGVQPERHSGPADASIWFAEWLVSVDGSRTLFCARVRKQMPPRACYRAQSGAHEYQEEDNEMNSNETKDSRRCAVLVGLRKSGRAKRQV